VIALGMVIVASSCLAVMFFYDNFWIVAFIALIGSIGVSASYAAVPTILVRAAPMGRVSETIGISSVIRSVGMAIGSQAMLTLLATSIVTEPGGVAEFPTLESYRLVFGIMIGACIAALLVAVAIPKSATVIKKDAPAPSEQTPTPSAVVGKAG
jgi:MFS family permease